MELDSMVSQLWSKPGSAQFPVAAAAFHELLAQWPLPSCSPLDGAPCQAQAMGPTPAIGVQLPWNSEPLIWPPASWKERWERSTASGCNPSNLFLNALSCEKKSWWWSICHSNGAFAWTPLTNPSSPQDLSPYLPRPWTTWRELALSYLGWEGVGFLLSSGLRIGQYSPWEM